MQITCGTDIIEIDRIQKSIEEMGERFLERVYTPQEIAYCESKKMQKYQHYAARFAAKEAVFKALSGELKDKYAIEWRNIEVINNEQGRPKVHLQGLHIPNIQNIDISISHCKSYAVANVDAVMDL